MSSRSASALLDAALAVPFDPEQEDRQQLQLANQERWPQGPVEPSVVNVAPEPPEQLPVNAALAPLPGAIEPAVQEVLDANGEPPLPVRADEDLPPVRQSASALLAQLDVPQERPVGTPGPTTDMPRSASALLAGIEAPAPVEDVQGEEIKLPAPKGRTAELDAAMAVKPVTTPEAADASDVTFEKDGPAFSYTGQMVVEPGTGPTAGIDGMRTVPPRGPVANPADPAAMEPALNRAPRLVPQGGQIIFDNSTPERFVQGVEEAYRAGLMPEENYRKIKENEAAVFKVMEDRRKLEEKAKVDPWLLSFMQGTGRGGAGIAGAFAGAKIGAAATAGVAAATGVGILATPVAAAVGGTAGAIVGGIGGTLGYDALYKELGKHFDEYETVMKAVELYPAHNARGQMTMAALALPVSAVQAGRGLYTAATGPGGLAAAGRQAASAAGAGAATGVVAYPIDAAVRGEEITPAGLAASAGMGAAMGGFFIAPGSARTAEVQRIFNRAAAGEALTPMEMEIGRAAVRPLAAAMQATRGGQTARVDVEVPTSSVMGMAPAAGRARVTYQLPPRLPAGAVRAAQDFAAARPGRPPMARPGETAVAGDGAATATPAVPRQAPVNVIPSGETIITPPPMTPAMMTPEAYADLVGTEKAMTDGWDAPTTEELFAEHFRIVRDAVNNNEPVSAAALELYEMRVPYYVADAETGLAMYDQATFEAWQNYTMGQAEEARRDAREAGAVELLDAVRALGGLPGPKSGRSKAVWSGELKSLWETARGGRDLGIKGAMNLFRNDAPDLDKLAMGLKARGFRVETEADLIELLDNRLRSGREIFGYGALRDDAMPEMVGGRRARGPVPGAPRQGELLGESDVEFSLTGQTDRTSLTPEEQAMAQRAADERARAEALQGDLFGAPQPAPPKDVREASLRPDWLRDNRDAWAAMYAMERPVETDYRLVQNPDGQYQIEQKLGNEWIRPYAPSSDVRNLLLRGGMAETLRKAEEERVYWASRKPMGSTTGLTVGTDPLTPPSSVASGGTAQVPPGVPRGMGALQPPDWVLKPGETSDGRRLIKGIENYRPGQRWGFRSIVDHVNRAVKLEMRRSSSQTTATNPAHYKPAHHMAFTRDTQSQINFHEAGHGLEYLLRARMPDVFEPFATELIGLTQRPGSMASTPPASLSPAQQRQYQIGEGVAEWTRLLMTDPAAVQNLKVTAAVAAAADQFYPKMAAALRDGARAVHRFQARPVSERWAMFNAPANVKPSAGEILGAIIRGGEAAVGKVASGAPVSALDRKIPRAIKKQRGEVGMTYKQALAAMRKVRDEATKPLMFAYNMVLSIGAETQLAIAGTGPNKGLRAMGDDGKFKQFTNQSWRDLRNMVPASKLAQYDAAAWALETLTRYEADKMEYPGMREGLGPDDLRLIVQQAEKDIPNFRKYFDQEENFHNTVLAIKEFGGLVKPEEVARIRGARATYRPLPRVMTAGRGGKGRGDISAGLFRARGSSEAIRQIDEVTEERVRQAFEAYYWNRFGLKIYDNMAKVAKDKSLPSDARILAGNAMVKMKMPMAQVASVSKEEALGWVMESIADAYEQALGYRPEIDPDTINLSWDFRDVWRPSRPGDVNVVSLLRNGEREFYQLGDPAMFALFSTPQQASGMGKFASWALGPMTQNWKRAITQGPVFALRNLFRDVFTQTMMNEEAVGWVPGMTHVMGAVNKWTQKYPQVFSEGLLLSRVEPSGVEMVNSIKSGPVWQWLTEGFYVSQAKDPVTRWLATVFQPSNWVFPLWKVADLFNLVTGGRKMAQFFEEAGREGAAVGVLRRGGTDEEALAKYWTAAGQFNEHAGVADARIAMNIPGFLNPMLQGVRNQFQKLTDPDPAVAGTVWARLLLMIPMMYAGGAVARYLFMNGQEKENERRRPVEDRMGFMDMGGFSIPFPYGVEGVMGAMVYNAMMDDLLGRPKEDADRTAAMMMKRIVDPGGVLQFLGPQFSSITEANMNWSTFRQRHIVAPWMVNLPAAEQYYTTTPEFYRKLGQWMNYSPAKLQYITQQALSRQLDDTVRLMESMDRGRPMQEAADVPFVGRMFVRDPIGFSSQPMRNLAKVEDNLRALNMRLQAKGWGSLVDMPDDKVPTPELKQLQMQLQHLEALKEGIRGLEDMQALGKVFALGRDYNNERNMRRMQTDYVQSLLLGNKDRLETLSQAYELLKQIPDASPEQKAADYLQRRF